MSSWVRRVAKPKHPLLGKVRGAPRPIRRPYCLLGLGCGQLVPFSGGLEFLFAPGQLLAQRARRVGEFSGQGSQGGELLLIVSCFLRGRFGGLFGVLEQRPGPFQRGGSGFPGFGADSPQPGLLRLFRARDSGPDRVTGGAGCGTRRDREAGQRLEILLNDSDSKGQSDFYTLRYLASEGFLPGYSFPRLPLAAFIPGIRRGKDNNSTWLQRSRFLAISEFGPDSLIYHEGARYQVKRVSLPRDSDGGGVGDVVLGEARVCVACGYLHQREAGLDTSPRSSASCTTCWSTATRA